MAPAHELEESSRARHNTTEATKKGQGSLTSPTTNTSACSRARGGGVQPRGGVLRGLMGAPGRSACTTAPEVQRRPALLHVLPPPVARSRVLGAGVGVRARGHKLRGARAAAAVAAAAGLPALAGPAGEEPQCFSVRTLRLWRLWQRVCGASVLASGRTSGYGSASVGFRLSVRAY